MAVSFNQIPSNLRVPLVYIEFDNSQAVSGTPAISHKILVLGQRLATGTVAEGVPVRITSYDQAEQYFGRGSMLAEMFRYGKQANRYTETWAIALDEDGAGAAATGKIAFSGPATQSGTMYWYIGGKRVKVGVSSGDTADAMASALVAAINAEDTAPATAAVNGTTASEVDLTARWKGETGNDIDIRHSYYTGESLPAGVGATITAMANGSGNPDVATAITALGDEWYHTIVMPYTDAANLAALEIELADRWGPTRQIDGIAYAAHRGTHSDTGTFGDGRNGKHVSVMGTNKVPEPPYLWATVDAFTAAASIAIDPARPLQTLPLVGLKPPAVEDRWTMEERNLHLYDGISTYMVDAGGQVLIERQLTTYQTNAFGVEDPSYLDVNTPATLSYIRYATRARITQKYPRHKLASNGTRAGEGQALVTPNDIRDELISLMRELETRGLVENIEQYKEDLIVERDIDAGGSDPNRINVQSHPDLVNQFRIYAEQTQFRL
ncbi:phage tail sheath subtilisin-like domain-containing protein [Alkalilimnicola sp. S0819]|uniref:phage tail sheath subtilisin-like domain-containing protein n=1 Tax=Alkalilimnicola sp. S0819 TaxID=2613922 RepID=UPI001261A67E|nr:phage tail sheath subtilisin-like domain-containing protein [Alkalilimnicola sp. S0819]KAB7624321.1 phage tail protein [Alkalilimnicola sp. S0819]MPQ16146.1 phage tail protein [Alkalilimnicola sp. S0819]